MTNDNHKCPYCQGTGSRKNYNGRDVKCDFELCVNGLIVKSKPLPSECPVCLTVQTGAHTCKRAKPMPSEPSCEPMLPDVCVGCYSKPCICKPVEPSVEEKIESIIHNCLTAEYLQQSEELRRMHRYYHARLLDNAKPQMIKLIAEALRNERNRK